MILGYDFKADNVTFTFLITNLGTHLSLFAGWPGFPSLSVVTGVLWCVAGEALSCEIYESHFLMLLGCLA